MPDIRTVAAPLRYEIEKIKGSRFIADVAPVADENSAAAELDAVRAGFPDAAHHCWAWRLDEKTSRFSDDGEPSGTAGPPILQQIDRLELRRTLVVVTRYFGGVKLGTGGLIRAYGAAARAALDHAEIRITPITTRVDVRYPYELSGVVKGVLSAWNAAPRDETYEATESSFHVHLPIESAAGFREALIEATAARASVRMSESDEG